MINKTKLTKKQIATKRNQLFILSNFWTTAKNTAFLRGDAAKLKECNDKLALIDVELFAL